MPQYMLDTDTVSFALRGQGRVAAHLLEHRPSEICISSITLAELRYGAEARRSRKLHRVISTFVSQGNNPELLGQHSRGGAAGRVAGGQDPQRDQAGRSTGPAVDEVRACHQSQDRPALGLAIPPSVLIRADRVIQ